MATKHAVSNLRLGISTKLVWAALTSALLLAACGKKDATEDAKAEDPVALSKPTPAPEAAPPAPPAPAPTEAKKSNEPAQEVTDETAEGDDEELLDDGAAGGKRRASRSHKTPGRKRSSTRDAGAPPQPGEDGAAEDTPAEEQGVIRLKRIQFAERIEGREPVEPEETFSKNETRKLYAFLELSNESKAKAKVTVTFVPPQGKESKVTLNVGDKPRWRTWALRKSVSAVGTWNVVVKDQAGREIGRRSFVVTE